MCAAWAFIQALFVEHDCLKGQLPRVYLAHTAVRPPGWRCRDSFPV